MRIYRRLTVRWDELTQSYLTLESDSFEYTGDLALCGGGGDSTASQSEQLSLQNQQQQIAFDSQLMQVFQNQYANQSSVLQMLQGQMTPIINAGGVGYSPTDLASMRTSATDQNADAYQNAQQALQNQEYAAGGRDLPSGVNAQLNENLAASEAAQQSGTQNQITQANENLKQSNYWNAINELNGVGASFNPQSYAGAAESASGAASSAGNSVAGLSQAVTAANNSGFFGKLGSGLGSSLGVGLGAGLSGGFGTLLSTLGSGNFGF